ncbi:MAG: agmatinase [Pseudomonadota bacterium]
MALKPENDHAFTRESLYGVKAENTFAGARSFMRLRYSKDLSGVDLAVIGVPFDTATTNRPGARFGPAGVRAASANLAWNVPWPWGFDPFLRLAAVDYGDCVFDHGRPDQTPERIEAHIAEILEAGASSLAIGGDHFLTLPILRAYAKKFGPMAIVHFDAHSDTWDDEDGRIDHGTMFWHAVKEGVIDPARSVQIGIRTCNADPLGITWLDADWVHEHGPVATVAEVKRIVGTQAAYLTFDIDCLDPAYAPGTGTPVVGGLSPHQARRIIRGLEGIDFKGMDVVEVAPIYDVGEVTSLAAATLALDYICLTAKSRPEQQAS